MFIKRGKKAQVTIFIIIAIVIVVLGVVFFLFKDSIVKNESFPSFVEPVETSLLNCLEEIIYSGIDILESHGGYIDSPNFESGSRAVPFSTHLNFVGEEIPYWFYYSRSNIPKEQIPSKEDMEKQLENYLEEQISSCDFEEFYGGEYDIRRGGPSAKVSISEKKVNVDLDMDVSVLYATNSFIVKEHSIKLDSKLGKLYDDAIEIYNKEQGELFLEDYGVDILRLYAPVDGVEWTCSPLVWNANSVFDDLREALEENTFALKGSGDNKDYFVIDNNVKSNLRFIYSKSWPYAFEVSPSDGASMISRPVGNQQGLGVLGFCYVTYHYVYNLAYPILVQVYEDNEIFQFPVAVSIKGNLPREALKGNSFDSDYLDLCENRVSPLNLNVFDSNGNPLNSHVSFECFGIRCDLGETEGNLKTLVPECFNGFILADSEGYEEARAIYNSVEEGSLTFYLDKKYDLDVSLKMDGKVYSGDAIINFLSKEDSEIVSYPETKKVSLSEGDYEVQVYVYKNSSLKLESSTQEQCFDIPSSGVGALFGVTKKECFEVDVPEQIVGQVLSGGGILEFYFAENQLKNSNLIELTISSLKTPSNIEELQDNYILFESKAVGVGFK